MMTGPCLLRTTRRRTRSSLLPWTPKAPRDGESCSLGRSASLPDEHRWRQVATLPLPEGIGVRSAVDRLEGL